MPDVFTDILSFSILYIFLFSSILPSISLPTHLFLSLFICHFFPLFLFPCFSPAPFHLLLLLPLPSLSALVILPFLHRCPHSYPRLPLFRPYQPWQPAVVSCPSPASRGQQVTCFWVGPGVPLSPLPSVRPSSSTAPPSSPW